jgi:hypothetical protein
MSLSQLSGLLLNAAYALFALFAAATLIDAMPPALLDSGWIVTTAASLVNFVTLPLVGLVFVHVAAYFTPTPRFQSIQARISRWAAIAALGFLLLAPLLGVLVIHNGQTIARSNAKARLRLDEQSNQLKRAVSQARTPAELQAAMVALKGPTLDSSALTQPLPSLQKQLIASIETTRARYVAQLNGAYSPPNWPVLKVVLRTAIQSILASLAFAALSWSSLSHKTLLERLRSKVASNDPQRTPLLAKLRSQLTRIQARLAVDSRMKERRALAEQEKRRRAEVKRRIVQETRERQKQARLFLKNADKKRRQLEKDADRDG